MDRFKFRICLKLATKSILLYSNNVDFDNKQIRLRGKDFKKQIESYNLTPEDNEILWKRAYYEEVDYYPDVFVEFDVIEQCIGLKDKNDKLIYEGDIIKFNLDTYEIKVVVSWDDKEIGFYLNTTDYFKDKYAINYIFYKDIYEIIGNIHENPELLEDNNDF